MILLKVCYKYEQVVIPAYLRPVLGHTDLCSKNWSFIDLCWCIKVLCECLYGRECGCLALWQPGSSLYQVVIDAIAALITCKVGLGLSTTTGQRLDVKCEAGLDD